MRLLALSTLLTLALAVPAGATIGDCGQPRSEGDAPTVGDVLYILGAVLHNRECPTQTCDVDDDCRVTLRDALETLKHVIERDGDLRCGEDCPVDTPRCGLTKAPTCGGACPDDFECKVVKHDNEVPVCHIPPGNPDAAHTIWIDKHAVPAHLAHGDYLGRCRGHDCRRHWDTNGGDDDCDQQGDDENNMSFSTDESTWWWWSPTPHDVCECRRSDDSTTTTTTSSTSTTSSSTTTTQPSGGDSDNDGLKNADDPCPDNPRNLCVGPVAVDGTAEADIRINAGVGGAACAGMKTDCTGAIWNADYGYNQAGSFTACTAAGGCPIAGVTDLFGCTDEATQDLFRCEHWDPATPEELAYSFDVPDGTYVVNLFFANTFATTSTVGSRTMDLVIEGQVVYAAFDQIAAAGGATQTAVVRSAVVEVTDGNGLQISFGHVVENPSVKGIEVLTVTAP